MSTEKPDAYEAICATLEAFYDAADCEGATASLSYYGRHVDPIVWWEREADGVYIAGWDSDSAEVSLYHPLMSTKPAATLAEAVEIVKTHLRGEK